MSEKISNGEYSTKLSHQQQSRHTEGTTEYEDYKRSRLSKGGNPQSIITISEKETQRIIETKSGTGIVKVSKSGEPKPQEIVLCDTIVGKYYGGGQYHDTNEAMIVYGKKSSHLVPVKDKNYD